MNENQIFEAIGEADDEMLNSVSEYRKQKNTWIKIAGTAAAVCVVAAVILAAKILADAVSNDTSYSYSAETLWTYQKKFYKQIGAALAPLACVKLLLTRLKGPELDYIFAKGILNADDMTIDADSTSLGAMLGGMSMEDIKIKVSGLVNNKVVLGKVVKMGLQLAKATAVTAAMPQTYNRKAILKWVKAYNACFKH